MGEKYFSVTLLHTCSHAARRERARASTMEDVSSAFSCEKGNDEAAAPWREPGGGNEESKCCSVSVCAGVQC